MAYGLLSRIIQHGLERDYWHENDLIGDCFGGIGSTGILCSYNNLRSVSVELEPRFVELATTGYECDGKIDEKGKARCGGEEAHEPHHCPGNFELHRTAWEKLGLPLPVLVQGDSRRFAEIVGRVTAAVTSPPFVDSLSGKGACPETRPDGSAFGQGKAIDLADYGSTPGQIGRLPAGQLDAAISSPPYAETAVAKNSTGVDLHKQYETYRASGGGASFEAFERTQRMHSGDYGASPGQIGSLKEGDLAAVVTSPPYAESIKGDHFERETAAETTAKRNTPGGSLGQSQRHGGYGAAPGNIGNLKEGRVDAAITSPPYGHDALGHAGGEGPRTTAAAHSKPGTPCSQSYGNTSGNISNLSGGSVDAAVTSPPWDKSMNHDCGEVYEKWCMDNGRNPNSQAAIQHREQYGQTPGQIGNLSGGSVEGIIGDSHENDMGMDRRVLRGRRLHIVERGSSTEQGGSGVPSDDRPEGQEATGSSTEVSQEQWDRESDSLLPATLRQERQRMLDTLSLSKGGLCPCPEPTETVLDSEVRESRDGSCASQGPEGQPATRRPQKGDSTAREWNDLGASGEKDGVRLEEGLCSGQKDGPEHEQGDNVSDRLEKSGGAADSREKHEGDSTDNGLQTKFPKGVEEEKPETYWTACAKVYREVLKALKPHGVLCVVVKSYVSKGRIVDLPADTLKLLVALGFEPLERVHAMLVQETVENTLFEGQVTHKKERKSFFRRLAEKNGSPRIDYEVVLFVRKP